LQLDGIGASGEAIVHAGLEGTGPSSETLIHNALGPVSRPVKLPGPLEGGSDGGVIRLPRGRFLVKGL
jgi:hypothetical protein